MRKQNRLERIKLNKNYLDIKKAGLLEGIEISFEDLSPAKQSEIFEKLEKEIIPEKVELELIEDMDYEDWFSYIVLPQIMDATWEGFTDEIYRKENN